MDSRWDTIRNAAGLLLVLFFCLLPLAGRASEVRSVGIAALSDGAVAIVIDATSTAQVNARALKNPDRLILDIAGMPYRAEAREGKGRGFVARYRIGDDGARDQSGTRIVLDLEQPALAESIEMVPGSAGIRMIIRLAAANEADFAAAALQTVAGVDEMPDGADPITTGGVPDQDPAADLEDQSGAVQEPPDSSMELGPGPQAQADDRLVIVIDAGHGGIDPGAVASNDVIEKEITLAFAKVLQEELARTGRYTVMMTRTDDSFVSLDDRVKIARAASAALMISIHADTLADEPGVRGSTVYTLADKASDARSARLAEKENAVDSLAGVVAGVEDAEVSDILFDLTRRETRAFSNRFAQGLITQLQSAVKINKNPMRFARFRVLTAPDVPSVLLELGYLSSEEDAKLVASPEWRSSAAAATVKAIDAFADTRLAIMR